MGRGSGARLLVVGEATYRWSVTHRHHVDRGDDGWPRCGERLAVSRDGAPGRLGILFMGGPGRAVPDGYLPSGGVATGDGHLNLHRPGVVRALLDEALARGWRPTDPGHPEWDGWDLFDAAVARVRAAESAARTRS
ncbi:hypothetical protein GA0070606_2502 [Micromonospora citrea]|uniref:Uncharacterized protein n=1 Tax=Micromonospora citrea TaxID=47855 RepID=A0A1C6UP71_9ACTN|nr:hypothetical protein [Micromonospora citrea]SCL55812.1 hypothetical protein GA0070606_2502 [Micromonospora citrea]